MLLGTLKKYDMFVHRNGLYAVTQDRFKPEDGLLSCGTKGVRLMATNHDGEWIAELSVRGTLEILDNQEVSRVVHIN